MLDEIKKLPVAERQDAFIEKWASGEGIQFESEEAKASYQYRTGLIKDAIQLKKTPDRVPVFPMVTFAPTSLAGVSGKQAMNDPHALGRAFTDFLKIYEPDASAAAPAIMYAPALEVMDYTLYKWPGHGVPDDLYYQFNEQEYMKADEYDHFITDLTDYWLRVWMPRTHGAFAPFSALEPVYSTVILAGSSNWLIPFGAPPVQEAFKALLEAGKLCYEWIQVLGQYMAQQTASGFPFYAGGCTLAPFDVISDSFRGTSGMMIDMYRQPDKVIKAQEVLTPLMIEQGVNGAAVTGNPLVYIPLHKGADGFMSNDQFEKFYWPGLKALILGLIEYGCVPVCFVEGGYNERLEYLTELPAGKTVFFFDKTDMAEAKRVLGGKACIGGGFPVSLIVTGNVQQVEDETKKLLDTAAGDGGYILSIGCVLDDAREDTLKAFINTGKEYGKY